MKLKEHYNINYLHSVFTAIKLDQTSILLSVLYSLLFLHTLITILNVFVYLHITIRIGWVGVKKIGKFWHSFQISLNYACKDFQFGTWLENRLQWASIFPLASNPEISSTTLKTFCLQSIRCYSHSHKRQDNNCRLSAFSKQKLTDAKTGQAPCPWCDYL